MTPSLFIDDGYSLPGYVKAEARMHPALRFTYRPCTKEERTAFWEFEERQGRLTEPNPKALTGKQAEILAGHLLTWECGRPIERGVVLRLHPQLFDKLFRVILGVGPPDDDPERPGEIDTKAGAEQERSDQKN